MKPLSADRLLQSQGYGTRRWCQQLIAGGEFRVDGEVVRDAKARIDPDASALAVFGQPLVYRAQVYLALNKPPGYECSRQASHHPGILTLLPEQMTWRDVQPVGRLDLDTTGLLLLSDDGGFIHRQASPRHHVPKRYRARVAEPVEAALIARMLDGVQLHDETAPLAALGCRQTGAQEVELTLTEGKYHQVKRMLAAAGNHCTALTRVAIGALELDALGLAEGEWCHLTPGQLALLTPAAAGPAGRTGTVAAPSTTQEPE